MAIKCATIKTHLTHTGAWGLAEQTTEASSGVPNELVSNDDPTKFYRGVARHIAARAADGWEIKYTDDIEWLEKTWTNQGR